MFLRRAIRILLTPVFFILTGAVCRAQFYTPGDEAASRRWQEISSAHFRLIYPRGKDSLAYEYGRTLEKYYLPVSTSSGFTPDFSFRRKIPVILHTHTAIANGSASPTPVRMDLFTTPDASSPLSIPWMEHLGVHELRHFSQYQFTRQGWFKPLHYIFGDISSGLGIALYSERSLLEGDAVIAETALTPSGRGRQAAFLEDWHVRLASRPDKSWYQLRYGSLYGWNTNMYALGYVTLAGIRTLWNEPGFTRKTNERIFKKGLPILNFPKSVREASGKNFHQAFSEIQDTLRQEWKALDESRKPFTPFREISLNGKLSQWYRGNADAGQTHYIIRGGADRANELVKVSPEGKEEFVHSFASRLGDVSAGDALRPLWWTEYRTHERWSLDGASIIRYMSADGKFHDFACDGKYFNVNFYEGRIYAIQFDNEGGSAVAVFDSGTGDKLDAIKAPDGLTFTDNCLIDGKLYILAVSSEGGGLFRIDGGRAVRLTEQSTANFSEAGVIGGKPAFICDCGGTNELYIFDPDSGKSFRLTSTPFGISHWDISADGKTLSFFTPHPDGFVFCTMDTDDLSRREVDLADVWTPRFAATIERQEKELGAFPRDSIHVEFSAPRKYSKAGHLFRLHSWAPFYFNPDAVAELSFESFFSAATLGASAFFQNDLGSMSASAGLSLNPEEKWIPSFNGRLTYSGFLPVMDLSFKIGKTSSGSFRTYIPWSWGGAWLKGFVPQAGFSAESEKIKVGDEYLSFTRATASLRGYIMRPKAQACIYPRFGVGAEIGYAAYPTLKGLVNSNMYALVYGYLPGIVHSHGIRLSALTQYRPEGRKYSIGYANIFPRGLSSYASDISSTVGAARLGSKFSFDYAFPWGDVQWDAMSPFLYLRNFEMNLHADFSIFCNRGAEIGNLGCAGIDFNTVLGNLLWIPFDTRLGVGWNYNFGKDFDSINASLESRNRKAMPHNTFRLIFNVDF
ncbi:MAG: hypothetical protein IJU69_01515 [Bacteroidales bacterium]|nr:hypothetical protein [Bacteroidales bacterium]